MNKLLYFPYIELPMNSWTIKSLLYWDEISSIVPYDYIDRPSKFGSEMRELVHEGLITQVIPEQYVYGFRNFEENFIKFIEENHLYLHLAEIGKLGELRPGKILKTTKIHMGKMANLGEVLCEIGLAYKNDRWYNVESRTAEAFMTYLSFLIGNEVDAIPATDKYSGFVSLLEIDNQKKLIKNRVRDDLRATILDKVLPVPIGRVNAIDILRVKNKFHDELIKFRNDIEKFLIDIHDLDTEDKETRIDRYVEEANDQINEIKDKLRIIGNIDFSFMSLCSLSSVIVPTADALINNSANELYKAIPGLLATIAATINKNSKDERMNKPFAYGAILSREIARGRIII